MLSLISSTTLTSKCSPGPITMASKWVEDSSGIISTWVPPATWIELGYFSFKNFNHTSSSVKFCFCILVSLSLSFSVLDFTDRLESKESSINNHSLYTRESTLDSSLWIETHYSNSIIESNDRYKLSQITSYSSTSSYDLPFLISHGLLDYRNFNSTFLGFENISYGTKYFWNIDNLGHNQKHWSLPNLGATSLLRFWLNNI